MAYSRIVGVLGLSIFLLFWCSGGNDSKAPLVDAGPDASGSTIKDAGSDASTSDASTPDTDKDTGQDNKQDAGDTEQDTGPEPGDLGEPCWIEVLGRWHTNYGLGDCKEGLRCIGNSEGAWCSESCQTTGAMHGGVPGMDGWCCGELTGPCNPQKFWLPPSMSFHCVPRSAGLAEECDAINEWTGENRRCASVCNGNTVVYQTICAQYSGTSFCTMPCDPMNEDLDCLKEPAFESGCCAELMGGYWCLIQELCPSSD